MGKDKRTYKLFNKKEVIMKKQKIRNRCGFYGEPVFNIASYYCSRNYDFRKKNSRRAVLSAIVFTDYLHNIPKKKKGKANGIQ